MKIGFSTNAYTKYSLSETIKSISRIGYDAIEIVLDIPHAFLPLESYKIDSIKKNLENHKLDVSNLNSNTVEGFSNGNTLKEKFEPSLSNTNKKLRDWRIEYTKKSIELAIELNSSSICITSGLDKSNNDEAISNFSNSLYYLASFAEKNNVKIGIEYEPGLLIKSSDDVLTVINEFKNVGLNFDVCHAKVLDENIPEIIKKFNKKLFHIHLSDCKNKEHFHLIPGLGEIDFKEMFDALNKINYDRFISVELYPYNKNPEYVAKESLSYIRELVC